MPALTTLSVLAVAAAEPAAQPISIHAALLIILGIALVLAIKSLADLHRRVDALHSTIRPRKSPAAPSGTQAEIAPEVLAVISAAVFDAVGTDHRIVSISTESQGQTWSQEGRRQIFSTRKVR